MFVIRKSEGPAWWFGEMHSSVLRPNYQTKWGMVNETGRCQCGGNNQRAQVEVLSELKEQQLPHVVLARFGPSFHQ